MSCSTPEDCSDRGMCIDSTCRCDIGWFGDICEDGLAVFWENGFFAYRVVFFIIYAAIGLWTFFVLLFRFKRERHFSPYGGCRFFFRIMKSPYNLCQMAIFLVSLVRVIWLAVDPFGYYDIVHRSVERLLAEMTYSLLFLVYTIVLWVWFKIYSDIRSQERKQRQICCFKWTSGGEKSRCSYALFRCHLRIVVTFAVCAQILTSILKGFRDQAYRDIVLTIYAILFLIFFLIIFEFIVYGLLLHNTITESEKELEKRIESRGMVESYTSKKRDPKSKKSKVSKSRTALPNITELDEKNVAMTLFHDSVGNTPKQVTIMEKPPSIMETNLIKNKSDNFVPKRKSVSIENPEPIISPDTKKGIKKQSSFHEQRIIRKGKSQTMSVGQSGTQKLPELHLKGMTIPEIRTIESLQEISFEKSVILQDQTMSYVWDYNEEADNQKRREERRIPKEDIDEVRKQVDEYYKKHSLKSQLSNQTNYSAQIDRNKLLDNDEFLKNSKEITQEDKYVIRRISTLTVIAISLQIIFAALTVIIFETSLLSNPLGVILSMWFSGFLEFFAIVAILSLFSFMRSQEKENLRIISTIGQGKNKINKMYGFSVPQAMLEDKDKREFVRYINKNSMNMNGGNKEEQEKAINKLTKLKSRSSGKLKKDVMTTEEAPINLSPRPDAINLE